MNYWFFQFPEDPDSEGKADAAAKTHSGIFRSTLWLWLHLPGPPGRHSWGHDSPTAECQLTILFATITG